MEGAVPSLHSFEEHSEAQVAASLPALCAVVVAVSAFYLAVLYFLQPGQFQAVLVPTLVQIAVPLAAWGLMWTPVRAHAQAVAFGVDQVFTISLAAELLLPVSITSSTALFISVKMLATALFLPWSARLQYYSAGATTVIYLFFFFLGDRASTDGGDLHQIHQILGPVIAALLSTAGSTRAERVRRELFRHDAELEELVSRLQMILDQMPIGCIISDAELHFTYWNPAAEAIFGYRFEELRGASPFGVITPFEQEEWIRDAFARLIAGEVVEATRGENLTKAGHRIVCEWKTAPLRRRDGRFLGILSMCQDVTAEQRGEQEKTALLEELKSANRLKSDFVATMSHELRTPLNVILGYNDLLLEGAFGGVGPEQTSVLDRVGQSGRELLELIDATLDVSRIEAGQVEVIKRRVQLRDLCAQLDAETQELQRKPGVRLEWRIAGELPALSTDPVKLKVVLKNLLTNALKFTDAGAVVVSAERRNGGVEVVVSDTGIGMSPESQLIIFEPFRQVDGSATRRHGGVGLGLYIAHRLVDMLGSTITVESAPGRGTMFRVWVEAAE